METMGWTWDELCSNPQDLVDELTIKFDKRNRADAKRARANQRKK